MKKRIVKKNGTLSKPPCVETEDNTKEQNKYKTINVLSVLPTKRISEQFTHISQIPADIEHISIEQVVDCLKLLNLQSYQDIFRFNLIDGNFLQDLDISICRTDLGMGHLEATRLLKFVQGWRPC